MDNTQQCDETNSIKYIINKGEYSLLKSKYFSEYDVRDFLTYCTPEIFSSLPKCCVRDIIHHASNIPHKIGKDMLDIFFDNGLVVSTGDIMLFAKENMADHLEKTLSRKNLTQEKYIELWKNCSTETEHIISKYFNDEAFDILREEKLLEGTLGIGGNECLCLFAPLTFFFGLLLIGIIVMIICGIIYDIDFLFTMGSIVLSIMFLLLIGFSIPLIYAFIKYKRKYDRLLNTQYTNF